MRLGTSHEWSLENVETCAAWWADARPIVATARALQGALREPGALERVLPALTSALAYAGHAAGYACPPGLVPPVPIGTRYG